VGQKLNLTMFYPRGVERSDPACKERSDAEVLSHHLLVLLLDLIFF
jgi:hypothetical protein